MTTAWIDRVRASLHAIDPGAHDAETLAFFGNHYRANVPCLIDLPRWPALNWTITELVRRIGDAPVEVQWNRCSDPNYELNSFAHKQVVPFSEFATEMEWGPANDTYLTAQNTGANRDAFAPLWRDVGPLPSFLDPDPSMGFFWLGRDTVTPLHHDETNNLMCQVMGTKLIRMFSPEDRDRLDPTVGVHSSMGWPTDEVCGERRLVCHDVILEPGQALFLPIGWWHCVKSFGVACTLVYTSFRWQNFFGRVDQ